MTPAVLWRELMSFHHKIKGFMKTSQIIVLFAVVSNSSNMFKCTRSSQLLMEDSEPCVYIQFRSVLRSINPGSTLFERNSSALD